MAKLVALGEVMMKLEVPDHRLLEQTDDLQVSYSGTGLNVLSGLSGLGYKTALVSALPNNAVGKAALKSIRARGIETEAMIWSGEYIGHYILEHGFSIRPSNVVYSNRSESSFCQSELSQYNLDLIFDDTSLIHICGIMLAVSEKTRALAFAIADEAKLRGVKVVFDCNYRPKLWEGNEASARHFYEQMLVKTDIRFMTEKDDIELLGEQTEEQTRQGQLEDVLPRIAKRFHIEVIAGMHREIEDGQQAHRGFLYDGTFAYSNNFVYNILERIGAGDGFCSGLLHGWLNGLERNDWIAFASAAGALAHTTYGDSPIFNEPDVWKLVDGGYVQIER